jgi:hypothetical protein
MNSQSDLRVSARSALMKQFNKSFPPFYKQFVSSEIQTQNLKMAYSLYQTRKAVVQIFEERGKTVLLVGYNNQSGVLSDILGVLTAFNLVIHGVNLYGQIYSPHLIFLRVVLTRNNSPLSPPTQVNLERAIHECLGGTFQVHDTLALEFDMTKPLSQCRVSFYFDQVFHLPAILIDADNEPGLLYRVTYALAQEDLTVVSLNLMFRKEQTRLIFYLLGPNSTSTIPEYLGQKIADSLRKRLGALEDA